MTGGVLSLSLEADESGVARADASLGRQGFTRAFSFAWGGGAVSIWKGSAQDGVVQAVESDSGVACYIGVIWYRERFGAAALELLIREVAAAPSQEDAAPRIDEESLRGNFALFLKVRDACWLLNDSLGFVRIYGSADCRFQSTSWLATRAYSGTSELDEAAAIEYVLLGAPHSDRTVARGVGKLALGAGLDLNTKRPWARFAAGMVPGLDEPTGEPGSLDDCVEEIATQLRGRFREIAHAFPGRTSAALSGGFDSRLILAGLLAEGQRPRLFVYGGAGSDDVPIAREIAKAEAMEIQIVDKAAMDRGCPEPDLDELLRSALFFDGLPNDGIHDAGADRRTRLEQSAGGFIVLNGGGGEIFRNFFHLPDRGFRPLDIVRAFYRGFDPGVFRRRSDLGGYELGLADSIAGALAVQRGAGPALSRRQVELAYPFFRCHHWMGLNNSVSTRHGSFSTPLIDLGMVRRAAKLPLWWKDAGFFESRLIAALHPRVASYRSTYGFRFSDGPDARARLAEWLAGARPIFTRPLIGWTRRRLQNDRVPSGLVSRCRALLPGEWRLDSLLDLERLPNDGAFERALSIEVVSRCL